MTQAAWNSTAPAVPGLYIASAARNRRVDMIRYWTGKHWTPPVAVRDLDLPGRRPDASWPAATDSRNRPVRIEWLAPFAANDPTHTPWRTPPPPEAGLYIASTDRSPGTVRYWTGAHWTSPRFVGDEQLPDRNSSPDWEAQNRPGRVVEWLEAYLIDPQGFIAWGGLVDESPLHPFSLVEVKLRSGARTEWPVEARGFRWRADGSCLDPVAYREVTK